jgi:hypothetical protein
MKNMAIVSGVGIDDIVRDVNTQLTLVREYPAKLAPHERLYDALVKLLPYLPRKKTRFGITKDGVIAGDTGRQVKAYNVVYQKILGIVSLAVGDVTNADTDSLIRTYELRGGWNIKVRQCVVYEWNRATNKEIEVEKRNFKIAALSQDRPYSKNIMF